MLVFSKSENVKPALQSSHQSNTVKVEGKRTVRNSDFHQSEKA